MEGGVFHITPSIKLDGLPFSIPIGYQISIPHQVNGSTQTTGSRPCFVFFPEIIYVGALMLMKMQQIRLSIKGNIGKSLGGF